MKRIIMFVLLFAALKVAGQTTGYLRFDTVKIMKQNGTCELYIINKTKDSLGLLTNIGGGLTQFKRPKSLNDSIIVIGNDTLKILGRLGGGGASESQQSITGDGTTGDKFRLVNDVTTPTKWRFYGTDILDSTKGWHEIEENFFGTAYNATSWASASTGFTNNSVTVGLTNGNLNFTAGSLYGSLALTTPYTVTDNYTIEDEVVIDEKSGTSYGSGIGTVSVNMSTGGSNPDLFLRFIAYTGGGSGELALTVGTAHTIVSTSSALTFSAGDTLIRTLTRNGWSYTGTIRNKTTNSAPVSITPYTFLTSGDVMPNTSRFAIFFLGGEFTINSLKITSNTPKNARLLLDGDSRFVGYTTTAQPARLADRLNANFKSTILFAGGFDRTIESLLTMPEKLLHRPQQALICLGYNDLTTGETEGDTEDNLDDIYNFYVANNIEPYFLLVATVSPATSTTALNAYLRSTYPNNIFDCEQLMLNTGMLQADGVHWTDAGNAALYDFIVRSYRLYGGNTRYGGSGGDINGTTNTIPIFTGPSSLGPSSLSSDGVRVTNTQMYEGTNTNPDMVWNETDGGTNEKIWTTEVNSGVMSWRVVNDARSAATNYLQITRSGNDVSLINHLKLSRFEAGIQMYNAMLGSDSDSDIVRDNADGLLKIVAPRATREALADSAATLRTLIASGGDGNGIYGGNGTLPSDVTVSTGGNTLTVTGSNDSETSFSVTNTGTTSASAIAGTASGTTSTGVTGTSSQYLGVFGSSTSSTGVQGQSSSGVGVIGVSSTGAGLSAQNNPAATNAISNVVTLRTTTSGGAGANGLGAAIQYELETATSGTSQVAGSTAFVWSDATNATRVSRYEIYGVNNATTARKAALAGSGQWTWDTYGANSFSVTPATTPVISSSGVVGERIAPKIYTCLLTATAGNDPTVTVLGTNEIGSIVWTRNSAGNYTGTLTGAFTSNKTWAMIQAGDMGGNFVNGFISSTSANTITLIVLDNVNAAADAFSNISIEIRVYP